MASKLRLLRARKGDIGALSQIYLTSFRLVYGRWNRRTAGARVRQALSLHPRLCFKVALGRETVGLILAEHLDFMKGKSIYIADIAVKKGFRRKGYGAQALRLFLRIAWHRGYKEVYLNAKPHAAGFYRKFGFRKSKYVRMEKAL